MKISPFTKSYGEKTVLTLPELELEQGRIYAVIGGNGSGKSTLAKVLSGVVKPDGGKAPIEACTIGYMPQKSYAFRMSVMKNLLQNGGDKEKAAELLSKMKISHLADGKAHKLSGGETARMALCRLFMREYELLILDEPTAAMDMESTLLAEELIREYGEACGCAVILITHSISQAARLSDYTLFFSEGELTELGETTQVLNAPQNPKTAEFLEFNSK